MGVPHFSGSVFLCGIKLKIPRGVFCTVVLFKIDQNIKPTRRRFNLTQELKRLELCAESTQNILVDDLADENFRT
jgi:hypothetical protein